MSVDLQTKVVDLACQFPTGLIGLPSSELCLTWRSETTHRDAGQVAYRVQVAADSGFTTVLADSGTVPSSEQIGVKAGEVIRKSRDVSYVRVAVDVGHGFSAWSETMICETGLLEEADWQATAIGDGSSKESASPLLRKEIQLSDSPARARLYVTSAGLNLFYINGKPISDSVLNPGWTAYQDRLLVETHDVTPLLSKGRNSLAGILSDGWWRGKLGFFNGFEHYGKEIGLLAQLEVQYPDGAVDVFVTDETWRVSTGEIRFSSIYDGSTIDYRLEQHGWMKPGFDDSDWPYAQAIQVDKRTIEPRITDPVRIIAEIPMEVTPLTERTLLTSPQNISGWVRLEVDGLAGQRVVIRHAEVLEPGQYLHTKALRTAKATDTYILAKSGPQTLQPEFTFHGFQYAEVQTEATIKGATAVAISSAVRPRSSLITSHAGLNKLHENVMWSQLDNFVSVPTDCPQRDERLGWTGDAQAFANTANILFDSQSFWRSWLRDLELDQYPNGDVAAVVPDILKLSPEIDGWIFEGRAGWADAATIVPFSVYEYFGDTGVLSQQLDSMRRWTEALIARRGAEKFLPEEFQFGDWCDPDAPGDRPWESKVSPGFVANSFFYNTLSIMAKTEHLVGTEARADRYQGLAEELRNHLWSTFEHEILQTTAGCSIALEFEIAPPEARKTVADTLARLATQDRGMISTGFLATPLILHALSKNGHLAAAYQMLLRTEFRSWLYAVGKGATTIWERWDAIREDGSIHTGAMDTDSDGQDDSSMISFNHYAYGAVVDWMYRNIGGLAPDIKQPGFQLVHVAPRPASDVTFANTKIETAYGSVALDWSLYSENLLIADLTVPFGAQAILELPVQESSNITCNGRTVEAGTRLSFGHYRLEVTDPMITALPTS